MSGRAFALLTATIEISKTIPPHKGGVHIKKGQSVRKQLEKQVENKLKTQPASMCTLGGMLTRAEFEKAAGSS